MMLIKKIWKPLSPKIKELSTFSQTGGENVYDKQALFVCLKAAARLKPFLPFLSLFLEWLTYYLIGDLVCMSLSIRRIYYMPFFAIQAIYHVMPQMVYQAVV